MRLSKAPAACLTLTLIFTGCAKALPCDFLEVELNELRDRDLFYSEPGGNGWVRFNTFQALTVTRQRTVQFALVIRHSLKEDRKGIVVIKSARIPDATQISPPRPNKVHLIRNDPNLRGTATCPVPGFPAAG